MNGIYSSLPPAHELPCQPINAMRAATGERPLCFDRPDFPPPMSPECKAWTTGDRAVPVPHAEGWLCAGCRHYPEDAKRWA